MKINNKDHDLILLSLQKNLFKDSGITNYSLKTISKTKVQQNLLELLAEILILPLVFKESNEIYR